jgi:CBS domain-containing protein
MNLVGARLARANEIELARVDGHWVVAGVDPGSRPVLRRVLPRPLRQGVRARGILDWSSVEPFVGHVPTARLRIPYRKLARLKPAQIADLVGSATVVHLLRTERARRLSDVAEPEPPSLPPDADVHQVLRTMADYNLTALAVVDGSDHVMGVITVDDVLELLLPAGWRREAGMAQGD